jgi:hypothetical protein
MDRHASRSVHCKIKGVKCISGDYSGMHDDDEGRHSFERCRKNRLHSGTFATTLIYYASAFRCAISTLSSETDKGILSPVGAFSCNARRRTTAMALFRNYTSFQQANLISPAPPVDNRERKAEPWRTFTARKERTCSRRHRKTAPDKRSHLSLTFLRSLAACSNLIRARPFVHGAYVISSRYFLPLPPTLPSEKAPGKSFPLQLLTLVV